MKNPLALLKKSLVNILKSPAKSLVTLLVLFDNLSQAKGNGANDNCHKIVFTPTGSGQSYTMEKTLRGCAELEILADTDSSAHCVSALQDYNNIYISSLSDFPRVDPKTGNEISDTLGFVVGHQGTGAIVRNNNEAPRKVWQNVENPLCASMTFFKAQDGAKEAPKIIDVSPTTLRHAVMDKVSYTNDGYPHCVEQNRYGGRCKMEL